MPTSVNDQFYDMDPANPPAVGTQLNFSVYTLVDNNDDEDFDRFDDDSVNGSDITASWPLDTITVNVPGVGNVTYTGTTFYLANGERVFTPTDGQVLQNGTFVSSTYVLTQGPLLRSDLGPPCFTPGVLIDTASGARPVENLKIGDLIVTADHGLQPIRYIFRKSFRADAENAPILFEAGVIGNDAPLLFSPNHRVLMSGWRSELICGVSETLAAAKHLVNGSTIRVEPRTEVEYIHLVFDQHEIVRSHGVWSESFFPGAVSELSDRDTMAELIALFPDLAERFKVEMSLARPMARRYQAKLLAA